MPSGYYIALSGMRARLDAMDRVASDIANVNTIGYKAERSTTVEADRPTFGATLQSAIDVVDGPTRVDVRSGSIESTGRDLDVALEGPGFFTIETSAGTRYTRDGRFTRRADGVLTTPDGDAVLGTDGHPITLPAGPVKIESNGTILNGSSPVGTIGVVNFDSTAGLVKESALRLRNDGAPPHPVTTDFRAGSLEQSNVSAVDRITELSTIRRNFESMQKAMTLLSNDVDSRAISELGRR
jgi:flagellar basal-body rod protein FlgF